MKKCFCVILFIMLILCGCSKTNLSITDDVVLTFIHSEKNINVTLEEDDAEKVISILNGKEYDPIFSGTPSCGFDKNITLKVGNRVFAIANDTCPFIQDLNNMRYFNIPEKDMNYIHSIFEKYGGYFPCV